MTPRTRLKALDLMAAGRTLTKYALADAAPCDRRTAQRALKGLHDERQCHIVAWPYHYHKRIPEYAYGPGRDAAKPKALTRAQKSRRRRTDPEVRIEEALVKRWKRIAVADGSLVLCGRSV